MIVNKSWLVALLMSASVALPLAAQEVVATKGKVLMTARGTRIGSLYSVGTDAWAPMAPRR